MNRDSEIIRHALAVQRSALLSGGGRTETIVAAEANAIAALSRMEAVLAGWRAGAESLEFALSGLESVRVRDNEYLIAGRDKALARIAALEHALAQADDHCSRPAGVCFDRDLLCAQRETE